MAIACSGRGIRVHKGVLILGAALDLTGKRFGKLVAIKRGEDELRKDGRHNSTFICQCDCGNIVRVVSSRLKSGNTQSCGCLHKQKTSEINKSHGMRNTRIYGIWCRMKQRCYNPNSIDYKEYGGRGISVAEEWKNSFENFMEWSMISGYSDNLTIDRKDNERGYSPDNCQWVSRSIQSNNKRNNRKISFNGKIQNISEWAKETGISRATIAKRIDILGWSVEDALTKAVRHKK